VAALAALPRTRRGGGDGDGGHPDRARARECARNCHALFIDGSNGRGMLRMSATPRSATSEKTPMPANDHSFSVVEESLPHDCTMAEYRRSRPQRRIAVRGRMPFRRRRLAGAPARPAQPRPAA